MPSALDAIEGSLHELDVALRLLGKVTGAQVRSLADRDQLKSTAYSWFNSHRPEALKALSATDLQPVDADLNAVLTATSKRAAKSTYRASLKSARKQLVALRSRAVVTPTAPSLSSPPNFSALAADPAMQKILARRWVECEKCITAGAALAAVAMMGGLLEALLIAKANSLPIKGQLFTARSTPKDKNGKPLPLEKWNLQSYINVAAELGWISHPAREFGNTLREYRNYIHPEKERATGVTPSPSDLPLFWSVMTSLCNQLLPSPP
jgi:hypothetical protein